MNETEFQRQVTDLAELYGWSWAHFRPAQTSRGWRTPVSGPLGKGFPDLVLANPRLRRILFVELKSDKGGATADQVAVLAVLEEAGAGTYIWRPADFDQIQRILSGQEELAA